MRGGILSFPKPIVSIIECDVIPLTIVAEQVVAKPNVAEPTNVQELFARSCRGREEIFLHRRVACDANDKSSEQLADARPCRHLARVTVPSPLRLHKRTV